MEKLSYSQIPEHILSNVRYPEFLKSMKDQGEDSCCINALRSVFRLSFGYPVKEHELNELYERLYNKRIAGNGIGPKSIAGLIHYINETELGLENIKVFMTRNGDYDQLQYFIKRGYLPIIHRHLPKELIASDDPDPSHYEIVFGLDEKHIYGWDSTTDDLRNGFFRVPKLEFLNEMWPVKYNGSMERWYLVATQDKLPRKMFKGKYC